MGVPCRCPRTGGLGQGQHLLWRRISQSEIRNSAAAEKRGRAKNPSPQPPSFLPARAFSFGSAAPSAAMGQFLSEKVRAKCIITAPKLTCLEMTAPRGEYTALRRAKSAFVFAVKSQSSPQLIESVLSLISGLEPRERKKLRPSAEFFFFSTFS